MKEKKKYCLKCHKELGECSCQRGWYTIKDDNPDETPTNQSPEI